MRQNGITKKIGVFHQDFEAQYTETTKYVERTLTDNLDIIEPYWICLPVKSKTATSMHEQYWRPWEASKKDIWVRDMPTYDGVINEDNQQFDFYHNDMLQEELYRDFAPWYHRTVGKNQGKTICLVGIRAQESLNRWRAINDGKYIYEECSWTTKIADDIYSGYLIYDWKVEDIWGANAMCRFDYNKLYDLFYQAGLSYNEMRVASPFNDWAIGSLKLYKVVEPEVWSRMIGRVNGVNFTAIYGGTTAMGWKSITLPEGHTWKSYVELLLKTLPDDTRKSYEDKFQTSIEFWHQKGGVLSVETIEELRVMGIQLRLSGKSNYKTDKDKVCFDEYPDDADIKDFASVPSYKRMAICIMKNDHLCKYMGFSQTIHENKKRQQAIQKFMAL
jgi:predicted phosphoadenosine phosphosulfate sulfurtransferase